MESEGGREPYITLSWVRTDPHVEIGTTNFVAYPSSKMRKWRAGIYIFPPTKQ